MKTEARRNRKGLGVVPRLDVFAVCMAFLITFLLLTDIMIKAAPPNNVRLPLISNYWRAQRHFKNFPGSTCYSIDISIDKNKRIFLEHRETTMASLPRQIDELTQQAVKKWITLQVDHRAPYGSVIEMARFLQKSLVWPERILLVVSGEKEPEMHHCE